MPPSCRSRSAVGIACLIALSFCLPAGRSIAAEPPPMQEDARLADQFTGAQVTGVFVLYDLETGKMLVSDEERARKRFFPASTFKIPNTLIGLETGAVKSVDEILPYGGKSQPIKAWEQDMSLRDAIKISNVPVYQEMARRIGLDRMREWVTRFGYGNQQIGEFVDRFWLDGPLQISAMEQTEFLARLVQGKLPCKPANIAAVKEITLLEKGEDYEVHAKTGWDDATKPGIGWWVGWVERSGRLYTFALNIDIGDDALAAKRIPLGRACLAGLGVLPEVKAAP